MQCLKSEIGLFYINIMRLVKLEAGRLETLLIFKYSLYVHKMYLFDYSEWFLFFDVLFFIKVYLYVKYCQKHSATEIKVSFFKSEGIFLSN